MGLTVGFDLKLNVVRLKATGEINKRTAAWIANNALRAAAKHKCNRVLCDYTDVKLTASILEIYQNPLGFKQWKIPRNLKIALLYSKDDESFQFWETRMYNIGFIARIFKQEDEAAKWLAKGDPY
jgi:hypothetical protein